MTRITFSCSTSVLTDCSNGRCSDMAPSTSPGIFVVRWIKRERGHIRSKRTSLKEMSRPKREFPVSDHCRVCQRWAQQVCAKCRNAWYCSKECQKEDWKRIHRERCGWDYQFHQIATAPEGQVKHLVASLTREMAQVGRKPPKFAPESDDEDDDEVFFTPSWNVLRISEGSVGLPHDRDMA